MHSAKPPECFVAAPLADAGVRAGYFSTSSFKKWLSLKMSLLVELLQDLGHGSVVHLLEAHDVENVDIKLQKLLGGFACLRCLHLG